MIVRDSLVHEVDVTRFAVRRGDRRDQVLAADSDRAAAEGVRDPQVAIFRMAGGGLVTTEVFVNTQVGYEVRCEAVAERGTATIGLGIGVHSPRQANHAGTGGIPATSAVRFARAYDLEVQAWVDASRRGEVVGPTTWDGYAATVGLHRRHGVPAPPADPCPWSCARPHRATSKPPEPRRHTPATKGIGIMSTPTRITHLIAGSPGPARPTAPARCYNPATGERHRHPRPGVRRARRRGRRDGQGRLGGRGPTPRWPGAPKVLFAFRQLLDERQGGDRRADHRGARQGPQRRARRGDPRARGGRVRLRHPAPAQGRLQRERLDRTSTSTRSGRPLGVVAVISPFNFPAMVPMWFIPIAIACGNAVVLKPSEKDPSAAHRRRRAVEARPACPTAS